MRSYPVRDDPILQLRYAVNAVVPFNSKVIDVGCGLKGVYQKEVSLRASRYVMIDAFAPYLEGNEVAQSGPPVEAIVGALPSVLGQFKDNDFNVALAIDVIEHLEPSDALVALSELKRIAACVVLFTPEGFYEQSGHDEYHMGGEQWQTHRSGWVGEVAVAPKLISLEALGFKVTRWEHFHDGWAPKGHNTNALWAEWRREQ